MICSTPSFFGLSLMRTRMVVQACSYLACQSYLLPISLKHSRICQECSVEDQESSRSRSDQL